MVYNNGAVVDGCVWLAMNVPTMNVSNVMNYSCPYK